MQHVSCRLDINFQSVFAIVKGQSEAHFKDKEVFVVIAKNGVSARDVIQIVGLETRTNPRHVNVVDVEKVVSV